MGQGYYPISLSTYTKYDFYPIDNPTDYDDIILYSIDSNEIAFVLPQSPLAAPGNKIFWKHRLAFYGELELIHLKDESLLFL